MKLLVAAGLVVAAIMAFTLADRMSATKTLDVKTSCTMSEGGITGTATYKDCKPI